MTGSTCTQGLIDDEGGRAAALGVRTFQLALPSWGVLDDVELVAFFDETCGRFPAYQFLHYNLPRAGRLVTADEYAALAEGHPNLVATKNTAPDIAHIDGLLRRAGELRHFLGEASYAYGSLLGEPGLLASISAIHAHRARLLFEADVARDVDRLLALAAEVDGRNGALGAAVGDGAHMDGAYDKLFAALRDPRFPLRLLPPYRSAPVVALEQFRRALAADLSVWVEAADDGREAASLAPG
jgi:hypothetical protein